MENKDLMIYNAVANVAARVFASFDAVMFEPGKYDVPAVLNVINKIGKNFQDEDAETAANEIVKIEIDTFACSFRAVDSFALLKRLAAAYQIPTACRAQFTKKADTAPVAVSFRVFAGLKDLCSRISKDDLHPCFNYICVDTKRRALIVCDQYTLSAVPVPEMYVAPDAKDTYLITPAVLKAGHGVCNIDANGTATNGAAVSAVDKNIKYPNIARVLFAVPSEFITLGKKVFSELKKNISAAAKFGKTDNTPVILKADAGANEIEIIGYRESETETNAPRETRRAVVSLPQPVPFAFAVAVDPERLGKVLAAEKMYLKDPFSPVCFVDETRRVFSVMYPGKDLNHTPYFNLAFEIPVPAGALSVDAVAGTFAPVQDAPAAPFEDEETAPAVPAVSENTKITFISKNYVPVITEEIRDAVAVAAEYKYLEFRINMFGTRSRREHTANVCAAELLLQRENLYIKNYALICGNGQTFAYISKHDEEIEINYDVAQDEETAAPADSVPAVSEDAQTLQPVAVSEDAQETAAPVPEDAQETPAADSVPAADIETLINNKFAAYLNDAPAADSVPAVSEETAPAVQDAPAVAVSLPVPVSAVYPLHAVYIDGVLHGVYFSKLLADEIFWSAFFAGRGVDDLEILSNETAPETERDAVARRAESCKQFAAVQDAPAVQDEETNAPAVVSVPEDEETPAVADSVPVSVDEETRRNIETAAQAYLDVYICTDEELHAAFTYLETQNIKIRRRRVYLNNEIIANITLNINNGVCVSVAVDYLPAVSEDAQTLQPVAVSEDAQETAPNVAAFVSVWACMPEIWQTDAPAVSEDAPAVAVGKKINAVPFAVSEDEETPAVANIRRRFHVWPWLIRAAAVIIAFILFAVNDAEKTPAVAVPAVQDAPDVPAVADSLAAVLFAVPEDAQETNDAPAVAVSVAAADSLPAVDDKQPQTAKKQPQTRRKRARRAESCKQFAAVAVADSLAADSVAAVSDSLAVADSLANVPAVADSLAADSVAAVSDSLAADSLANVPAVSEDAQETAPAVQDEETNAPAVVSVPEDEETPAVADSVPAASEDAPDAPAADSVPADSVPAANSPAPAVPAVSGCQAVPAAVTPYVIGCVFIH